MSHHNLRVLYLNVKKTQLLIFKAKKTKRQQVSISLDGSGIKHVESARFWGVHIDENIDWKNLVSHVCSKIAKLSGILCRARHYWPRVLMRGLYHALIYPYLMVTLYGKNDMYTTRLEPIRRLQKKIIRIITFWNFKEHSGPLFKELLISPLDDINNEAIALFMFRYFNNNLPSSFNDFFCLNKDVHQFNTRLSSNVHKVQART